MPILGKALGQMEGTEEEVVFFSPKDAGSPGRTRTCDQPVNSRLLYQLSYRGTRYVIRLTEAVY